MKGTRYESSPPPSEPASLGVGSLASSGKGKGKKNSSEGILDEGNGSNDDDEPDD